MRLHQLCVSWFGYGTLNLNVFNCLRLLLHLGGSGWLCWSSSLVLLCLLFRYIGERNRLCKDDWFLSLWLCGVLLELTKGLLNVIWNILFGHGIGISADDLCQIDSLLFHELLGSMQFVPQFILDFTHISPGVHLISLDIIYLFLCFSLLISVAFVVLDQVGFLWALNYYLCNFLWGLNLIYSHFISESLLYNLSNRHVVNLLLGVQFSLTDSSEAT